MKRRAEIYGQEPKKAARLSGGRFEHFGVDAGVPRSVNWIGADSGNGGIIILGSNQAFRFSDGKFSPLEAGSNFPLLARAVRSSNVKIPWRYTSENKIFECLIDGRGFDLSARNSDLSKRSFGLTGISERTRLLGGKLNIESVIGKGTNVSIIIDLHR